MRIRRIVYWLFQLMAFAACVTANTSAWAQCTNVTPNYTFTPAAGCAVPKSISFVNTSTGSNANNANTYYYWFVNGVRFDSTVGTAAPINATVYGPGTYTLRMQVHRVGSGCVQNVDKTYNLSSSAPHVYDGNAVSTFTPTYRNCILNPLASNGFQLDLSSPDTLKNYTIIWGDTTANTSGLQLLPNAIVSHTYANLNVYTIKIKTNNGGCNDTIIGTVYNLRPPNTSILPITGGTYVGCAPLTITYRDSTVYAFPGTTLTWDFGVPGGTFTRNYTRANDTINFTYPLSSALAVCPKAISLTINNPQCGSPITNTKSGEVQVYNKSAAGITPPTPLCATNRTYTFTNSSTNNCVGSDKYKWKTIDSTIGWIASKGPVTITFPSYGNQSIRLIDSNTCGVDSIDLSIVINRAPVAGFTANPKRGCSPLGVSFNDTSLGTNLTRTWAFSGGTPASSSAASPNITYNAAGTFPVTLSVSNTCGSSGPIRDTIRVFAKPSITINNSQNGCVPHSINLTSTVNNISSNATYLWRYQGGTTSSLIIPPTITYMAPTTDTVWLVVTDTCGKDSSFTIIRVSTLPVASFTSTVSCRGDSTIFTNTSTLAPGDVITNFKWYFGTGDSSTSSAPKYPYATAGNFQAVLKITTDKTCVDFDTATVTVKVAPVVSIANSPLSICDGTVVNFDGTAITSTGTIIAYEWTFGSGITDTAHVEDTNYLFPAAGNYQVRFKANNSINCSTTVFKNITINPNPDSRPTSSIACFSQLTQLRDSSTVGLGNSITQWQWDIDNNGATDSTVKNPSYFFASSGTHRVKLRVGTNNNCFNLDSVDITVNPIPVVHINTNTATFCKLDSISFSNTTTGANSYLWHFGDGVDSLTGSLTTIKKTYSDSGHFTTKMIATTALGCSDSASINLVSNPWPVSSFVVNDTVSCAPHNFQFTNQSILSNSYVWQVNGSNNSTATNRPDTLITTSGQVFQIKLIASNLFGCKPDTAIKIIQTITNPIPLFSASKDSGCGPLFVQFNNASSGATSFNWLLGNGDTATSIHTQSTYQASSINDSIYAVKLIAMNGTGCKDSLTKNIRVFPKPVSAFTQNKANGCGPFSISFSNSSTHKFGGTIDSFAFNWNFGDGILSGQKNPSHTYIASKVQDTNYTSRLIVTTKFGCKDTAFASTRVFPNATSTFVTNLSQGCGPLPVQFNNLSVPNDTGHIQIMSFKWNFGNGVQSLAQDTNISFVSNPIKDTIYQIQLIAYSEHQCPDTSYKNIKVFPKPLADFTTSSNAGCSPFSVNFVNQSQQFDTTTNATMQYLWDLGNGFNSINTLAAAQYFSKTLADSIYHVKLFAFSIRNCKDTTLKSIVAHPKPIVNFVQNKTQGCGPLAIQFTNTSQLASNSYWKFGDGDSSVTASPSHTYQSYPLYDSVYTPSLVVKSIFGCWSDTASSVITARYKPIAGFMTSADSICGTGNVSLYNVSLGGVTNQWNFGDGQTSTVINPAHIFQSKTFADTAYQVRLVVTSPFLCKDTTFQQVKVNYLPDAKLASVNPGCTPLTVLFNNQSIQGERYEWDFGDASSDTVAQPTKVFVNGIAVVNRSFPVTLKAYSRSGCTDTAKQNVLVYPKPLGDFSYSKTNRCDTAEYNFLNATVGASSYLWKFADAQISTQSSPTHYFSTAAHADTNYQVLLVSSSTNGCKDSISKPVQVKPLVVADFVANTTSSCSNLNVAFTNHSLNGLSYFWIFGDGSGSPLTHPIKQYSATGTYTVQMIAYDIFGCSDTAVRTNYVQVYDVPSADFIYSPPSTSLPNSTIQFTDLSSTTEGVLNYQWNFGESSSSSNISVEKNPSHTYSDSGNYTTTLIVNSVHNCYDTATNLVRIGPHPPVADFDFGPREGCVPLTVFFNNKSQYATEYKWFIDGKVLTDFNPSYSFVGPRSYPVTLQAIGPGGNDFKTISDSIIVHDLPKANFVATPLQLVLPDATVYLTDISYDATAWEWTIFGDVGTDFVDHNQNTHFTFNADGLFSVRLIAQNQFGCKDTLIKQQIVEVISGGKVTVPNAFTPNGDSNNETFKPILSGVLSHDYLFSVYNRWGQLVFETDQLNHAWDGTINGKPAATDVYVWIVRGYYNGDISFTKDGQVSLLR